MFHVRFHRATQWRGSHSRRLVSVRPSDSHARTHIVSEQLLIHIDQGLFVPFPIRYSEILAENCEFFPFRSTVRMLTFEFCNDALAQEIGYRMIGLYIADCFDTVQEWDRQTFSLWGPSSVTKF